MSDMLNVKIKQKIDEIKKGTTQIEEEILGIRKEKCQRSCEFYQSFTFQQKMWLMLPERPKKY